MSVIAIDLAVDHLKTDGDDQQMIEIYLAAAEESAAQFMNRRFYANQQDLLNARSLVPAARAVARVVRDTSLTEAEAIADHDDRALAFEDAQRVYQRVLDECAMCAGGIVVNQSIVSACLLILGHLYSNREDSVTGVNTSSVTELPGGSRSLLWPYRINLGV